MRETYTLYTLLYQVSQNMFYHFTIGFQKLSNLFQYCTIGFKQVSNLFQSCTIGFKQLSNLFQHFSVCFISFWNLLNNFIALAFVSSFLPVFRNNFKGVVYSKNALLKLDLMGYPHDATWCALGELGVFYVHQLSDSKKGGPTSCVIPVPSW